MLHAYGEWQQLARQGMRGRFPDRRRVPRSDLLYAQVVKQRERGHVVQVSHKVVFGDPHWNMLITVIEGHYR